MFLVCEFATASVIVACVHHRLRVLSEFCKPLSTADIANLTPSRKMNNSSSAKQYHNTGSPYLTDEGSRVLLSILMLIMVVISLIGNVLVCYVVYRKPAMRSGINLLLANLALSDLFMSVTCMPLSVAYLNIERYAIDSTVCQLEAVFYLKFQTEKIFLLVVISVDRYYIIVKRKDNLNTFKAKLIIAVTWLLSLLLTIPPLFGLGSYNYVSFRPQCSLRLIDVGLPDMIWITIFNTLSGFLPCGVMILSYAFILRTVRRNCFRVQNHPPVNPTAMHRKGKLFIDYSYKTRTFTTISLLTCVYILCVLPIKFLELWIATNGRAVSVPISLAMLWLSYAHTALNPIIYTIRIRKFREACLEIMPRSILTLPDMIPMKARRRIRPHSLYQVNKQLSVVTTII